MTHLGSSKETSCCIASKATGLFWRGHLTSWNWLAASPCRLPSTTWRGTTSSERPGRRATQTSVSAFVDTNILVRHLTGEPPQMAARATAYLRRESELFLTDLVVAETVYVLESFYEVPHELVAEAVRSLIASDSVICVDPAVLLRSVEVYETQRINFAEACLVACAESTGIAKIASFDRSLDRVQSVERVEPTRL